jgi:uncharacterized membrane protein YeaQ/YmgE (transglycosylase-associated protein family)
VVEDRMAIVAFVLFGLIIGLLARVAMPSRRHMSLVATALLGIAGAFVGGLVGSLVDHGAVTTLHAPGLVGSVVGALVVLALAGWEERRVAP